MNFISSYLLYIIIFSFSYVSPFPSLFCACLNVKFIFPHRWTGLYCMYICISLRFEIGLANNLCHNLRPNFFFLTTVRCWCCWWFLLRVFSLRLSIGLPANWIENRKKNFISVSWISFCMFAWATTSWFWNCLYRIFRLYPHRCHFHGKIIIISSFFSLSFILSSYSFFLSFIIFRDLGFQFNLWLTSNMLLHDQCKRDAISKQFHIPPCKMAFNHCIICFHFSFFPFFFLSLPLSLSIVLFLSRTLTLFLSPHHPHISGAISFQSLCPTFAFHFS